jgi:hypothetical protein
MSTRLLHQSAKHVYLANLSKKMTLASLIIVVCLMSLVFFSDEPISNVSGFKMQMGKVVFFSLLLYLLYLAVVIFRSYKKQLNITPELIIWGTNSSNVAILWSDLKQIDIIQEVDGEGVVSFDFHQKGPSISQATSLKTDDYLIDGTDFREMLEKYSFEFHFTLNKLEK